VASEQFWQAPAAVASPPGGRARWSIVALLMAVVGLSHLNRISIATAGNARIMGQYGLAPTRMGWIYSAFLIAYTACMIPGGWAIDRFGAKAAMMAVGFGSALFMALTGAVGLVARDPGSAFIGLLLVRGLMGVVSAPLHPASARVVGHWVAPGGRSLANGLVNGSALVGIAATPIVFGALIARLDWPAAFLVAGAATAGLALAWTLGAEERPGPPAEPADPPETADLVGAALGWRALLLHRGLILLTLGYAAVGYFQYLFFYWMNYYFQKILMLPESRSRWYEATLPLAMAAGMPLGGWLSDQLERSVGVRWGRRLVPMAGMLYGAAMLGLGVLSRQPAWIAFWFALALGAVGAAEGPFWATAVELGGRRGGSSAALLNTGGNAGGLLAPIVTPWVGRVYGWPWAVALGGLVSLVGAALWLGIDPERRVDESEEKRLDPSATPGVGPDDLDWPHP
jgi:MFS transporter, ACS family, D-galactonate transporter